MLSAFSDLGSIFFGCVVTSIFYGITTLQTFIYFSKTQGDSAFLNGTFGCLWILDSTHTAFVVYLVYHYAIIGQASHLIYSPDWWEIIGASTTLLCISKNPIKTILVKVIIFISNVSDCTVRLVFLHRIWMLTNRRLIISVPIGLVTLVTAGLGMSYSIRICFLPFAGLESISWQLYATLATAPAADLLITATLCILFHRIRSGFKKSNSVVTSLMLYTINSGLFSSLIAIATLTSYALLPNTYIYMSVFLVMNKASYNALLAATNARSHLREQMMSTDIQEPWLAAAPILSSETLAASSASMGHDVFAKRMVSMASSSFSAIGVAV
ncbi:hypothetical protein BC835DRAFT_1413327 [Cytidiella melzeri]|nr:hypothetical protein BC835DRAFT_1413327 [Cytidiella melzeri]